MELRKSKEIIKEIDIYKDMPIKIRIIDISSGEIIAVGFIDKGSSIVSKGMRQTPDGDRDIIQIDIKEW